MGKHIYNSCLKSIYKNLTWRYQTAAGIVQLTRVIYKATLTSFASVSHSTSACPADRAVRPQPWLSPRLQRWWVPVPTQEAWLVHCLKLLLPFTSRALTLLDDPLHSLTFVMPTWFKQKVYSVREWSRPIVMPDYRRYKRSKARDARIKSVVIKLEFEWSRIWSWADDSTVFKDLLFFLF
jgi:hypothetical protein